VRSLTAAARESNGSAPVPFWSFGFEIGSPLNVGHPRAFDKQATLWRARRNSAVTMLPSDSPPTSEGGSSSTRLSTRVLNWIRGGDQSGRHVVGVFQDFLRLGA